MAMDPDELLRTEFEKAYECYDQNKANKFCILCRKKNTDKRVQFSHIIPQSVLRSAIEKEPLLHSVGQSGQELGHRVSFGYKGYCRSCEDMLSKMGEKLFNPLVHVPLISDFNSAVHVVEGDDAASVSHCALSMWWRTESLSRLAREKSAEGRNFRKLLEYVRVWLHNPREYLPYGVQFSIAVYHPDDVSELRRHELDLAATKYYGCLDGADDRRLRYICMGPVRCCYTYFKLSCFSSSSPIHIHAGEDRLRWPDMEQLIGYMWNLKDRLMQQELRVRNQVPSSSEGDPELVSSADIIPTRLCTYINGELKFRYHHLFEEEKEYRSMKLQLYKPTNRKRDDPSCNAVLTLPTRSGQGLVRVWLQSVPPEHQVFKIAENAPVHRLADDTVQKLEGAVNDLNMLIIWHDFVSELAMYTEQNADHESQS